MPRLLLREPGGPLGDVVVVEDVRGGTLEQLIAGDPERAGRVSTRLGSAVRRMHGHTSGAEPPGASSTRCCAGRSPTSPRPPRASTGSPSCGNGWPTCCARGTPPSRRVRASARCTASWAPTSTRLTPYRLATYLSLVAGPLRLLDGDFPHRAGMLEIVAQDVARTLAELPR